MLYIEKLYFGCANMYEKTSVKCIVCNNDTFYALKMVYKANAPHIELVCASCNYGIFIAIDIDKSRKFYDEG